MNVKIYNGVLPKIEGVSRRLVLGLRKYGPIRLKKFLYSPSYGGFELTERFLEVYEELNGKKYKGRGYTSSEGINRTSDDMIDTYDELTDDEKYDIGCSHTYIPEALENFVDIESYDGSEFVSNDNSKAYKYAAEQYMCGIIKLDEFINKCDFINYIKEALEDWMNSKDDTFFEYIN